MHHPKQLYQSVFGAAIALYNRRSVVLIGAFFLITIFVWYESRVDQPFPVAQGVVSQTTGFDGTWNCTRDRNNLALDRDQCQQAFPGLFEEVNRAVSLRRHKHISVGELDSIEPKNGYVRAMIYDQELYIIATKGKIYSREKATLQSLYRAIISSPELLPNIEFAFNTDDIIFDSVPLWAYARRPADTHIWLIPDFGYWSWPETKVGTMREVQIKAAWMESAGHFSWEQKIPKLLWRGATMGLRLRDRLLEVSAGKPWADVEALDWHNKESMAHDLKSMPEHCQYRYLAHTEGNSYSGRLKYLQACRSVVIAHKMHWIQHYHPLMHSTGPDQNYVEVDRNFDELEATVLNLDRHDRNAERIASNSVSTFRERYLTPAAEVCYWRRLIYGWAAVSFQPDFFEDMNGTIVWRGLPIESFLLEGRLKWDPY